MKKSCSYCGRIHDKNFDCGKRPKRKKRKFDKGKSKAAEFRSSNTWRKLSISVRERDFYMCQACLHNLGSRIRYSPYALLEVHHIEPIEKNFDRREDETNLITLCGLHHQEAEDGTIDADDLFKIAKENTRNK